MAVSILSNKLSIMMYRHYKSIGYGIYQIHRYVVFLKKYKI